MESFRRNEFKVLLGATKNNSLVFGEIRLPRGNNEGYGNTFSASFDEVTPFEASDEYLRERFEGHLDCLDDTDKLSLLERYDCRYSELEEVMFDEIMQYEGVEGIEDISLYSESFNIKGLEDEVYFHSDGCGQHDTRDELIPIDKEFSNWLHDTWDKLHLKEISEKEKMEFETKIRDYENKIGDEENWIQNWLEEIYQ